MKGQSYSGPDLVSDCRLFLALLCNAAAKIANYLYGGLFPYSLSDKTMGKHYEAEHALFFPAY